MNGMLNWTKIRFGPGKGAEIGSLGTGGFITIDVPPGRHEFMVSQELGDRLYLDAEVGETYYVAIRIHTGVWAGHPNLYPVNRPTFEESLGGMSRKKSITAGIGATAYRSPVAATAGIEGKHWAAKTIDIVGDTVVTITATTETVNGAQHNSSRVVLKIDDKTADDKTADAGAVSTTVTLKGPGRHELVALCYNDKADAGSCTITVVERQVER
eukprot:gene26637-26851_t